MLIDRVLNGHRNCDRFTYPETKELKRLLAFVQNALNSAPPIQLSDAHCKAVSEFLKALETASLPTEHTVVDYSLPNTTVSEKTDWAMFLLDKLQTYGCLNSYSHQEVEELIAILSLDVAFADDVYHDGSLYIPHYQQGVIARTNEKLTNLRRCRLQGD